MMKQLLFLLFALPAFLSAQDDTRYLAGAVPEVDGKVIFSHEIKSSSLSQNQIYDRALNWAEGFFDKERGRVVFSDKGKGNIAALGDQFIIFTSTALSLDRSRIIYQLTIECKEHSCLLKMGNIRYVYDVSYQRDPERYEAENWITDKYSLNKSKTKLNRISGKFRRETIDLADELFKGASLAFGAQPAIAAQVEAPAATPANTVEKEGFVSFSANQIPATILQMLPESPLSVSSATNKQVAESNIQWKGLGSMFGKETASFSISQDSPCYQAIGTNDVYAISFLKKEGNDKDEWMIIECRKQGETPDGERTTIVGEVLNIWIK